MSREQPTKLTASEFAAKLGITRERVYHLIDSGMLEATEASVKRQIRQVRDGKQVTITRTRKSCLVLSQHQLEPCRRKLRKARMNPEPFTDADEKTWVPLALCPDINPLATRGVILRYANKPCPLLDGETLVVEQKDWPNGYYNPRNPRPMGCLIEQIKRCHKPLHWIKRLKKGLVESERSRRANAPLRPRTERFRQAELKHKRWRDLRTAGRTYGQIQMEHNEQNPSDQVTRQAIIHAIKRLGPP